MAPDAIPPLTVAKVIKPKKRCCKSRPRCKKCPVVCKRLVNAGLAEKKALKAARK